MEPRTRTSPTAIAPLESATEELPSATEFPPVAEDALPIVVLP